MYIEFGMWVSLFFSSFKLVTVFWSRKEEVRLIYRRGTNLKEGFPRHPKVMRVYNSLLSYSCLPPPAKDNSKNDNTYWLLTIYLRGCWLLYLFVSCALLKSFLKFYQNHTSTKLKIKLCSKTQFANNNLLFYLSLPSFCLDP